MIVDCYGVSLQ